MKVPSLEQALALLEGDLPNRSVDAALYVHKMNRIGAADKLFHDGVPDFVPRYTSEYAKALDLLAHIAPYASWRVEHDSMQVTYTVIVLGQRATSKVFAIAICAALIRHIKHRGSQADIYRKAARDAWRAPVYAASDLDKPQVPRPVGKMSELAMGYGEPAMPQGPATVPSIGVDLGKPGGDTTAVVLALPMQKGWNLVAEFKNPKAAEAVLALKDRLYLGPESSDDDWCEALMAAGFTPRDLLDELPKIRDAVALVRKGS